MILNPAGFQNRFLAHVLDFIILFIVLGMLSQLIYGVFYSNEEFFITDLVSVFYYLLLPVFWYGYTLGRKLVGNRIARVDGKKVRIGTMLLRHWVAGMFYVVTLGIGFIISAFMVGLREDKRAIHDFIAQTYVTTDPPGESNTDYEE
ncbi:RDD family protein [Paraliobacillus sp. PM-2]|uniref:RDD family protein n=1 Tax=Paraliobacillus sp. PM-2 TaxID=1462524 RepID=UPI00061C38F0|nr:RDD family protein [Paraliobacillus sp. PM-2]CQR47542.1 RDD family protein [Paraliobacillus sp. PM-2]